ncbi:MAG TPA: nuclear transport factor 2 family protein [Acidimicrobiales bacterium]|nr:nuclear transport factor 2 family protein [Acidimicrobiales bacterium]
MAKDDRVLAQYRRKVTEDSYTEIRELYKAHSVAEDNRDIAGLLSTLAPDCVYELCQIGVRWEGHDGAARFYTELLTAFPDIVFDLRNIVIGPQGVFEEADVTGTWKGPWLGREPSGEPVEFRVLILFPYDEEARLFSGERVYIFPEDLLEG